MYNYDQKRISIEKLLDLLNLIKKSPTNYHDDVEIRRALNRQSALAHYSNEAIGIYPTSLNAMKAHAQQFIPGGFSYLDSIRRSALESFNKQTVENPPKNSNSKIVLTQKINSLKSSQIQLMQDMVLMTMLLEKAIKMASNFARMEPNDLTLTLCQKETEEIYRSLGFRMRTDEK